MRLFVLAMVVAAGCSDSECYPREVRDCVKADMPAMQAWVLDCIEKANPKSDEEPEDWIRQCLYTAEKLFCPMGSGFYCDGNNGVKKNCREATTPKAKVTCAHWGKPDANIQ